MKFKTIIADVDVNKIVFDKVIYPRNDVYWQVSYDYSESMKVGAIFPKIELAKYGDVFKVIDGMHRINATKILKIPKIRAIVHLNLSDKEIYELAVRRNITHGKNFSVQEKLQIAVHLKDLKYTTSEISNLVQITPDNLKKLIGRKLVNSITGKVILKKGFENISKNELKTVEEMESISSIQREFQGSSQETLLKELIVLIESNSLNIADENIKSLIENLKKLLMKIKL